MAQALNHTRGQSPTHEAVNALRPELCLTHLYLFTASAGTSHWETQEGL